MFMDNNSVPSASSNIVNPIKPASKMPLMIAVGIVVVLVGLGVGFLVSGKKSSNKPIAAGSKISVSQTEAGVKDPSTIKDVTTATGVLKIGGIKGEGKYHLERPGGLSETVYLTSTTVDVSPFVDKKVQVWGQTLASQNAGWFMDVMKIKIVD